MTSLTNRRIARLLLLVAGVAGLGASCGPPPAIVIDGPAHGSFSQASSILVTGHVVSAPAATSVVTVNGVATPIEAGGTWSASVPLDATAVFNPIVAELTLASGATRRARSVVIASDSIVEGAFSPGGVALRLRDAGLDEIESVLTDLVDLDLIDVIPAGTRVINNFCYLDGGFLGCLGSVDVHISDSPAPSIQNLTFDVDAETDVFLVDVLVEGLELTADVTEEAGANINCEIDIDADQMTILTALTIEPDASDPSKIDVVQDGGVSVQFDGFDDSTSCSGLLGGLVETLIDSFVSDVEDLVEDGVRDALDDLDADGNTLIAASVEGILEGLDVSGAFGDLLDTTIESAFSTVSEDPDGLTIGIDAAILTSIGTGSGECTPPAGAPELDASYHLSTALPSYGATTPINGLPYHLALGISTSTFGQLMRTQTECGLLNATIDELDLGGGPVPITGGLLALFVPEFSSLEPSALFEVELLPTLAPILLAQTGPAGEEATLKLAQLQVRIVPQAAPDSGILTVLLDATLGLDLAIDPEAQGLDIVVGTPAPGDVSAFIVDNPLGVAVEPLEDQVLPLLAAALLPDLASALGSFPLPKLLGFALEGVETAATGEHLSLFANLSALPPPPPEFVLFEDFEGLTPGGLDGQGGWHAGGENDPNGGTGDITVEADGANQLLQAGPSSGGSGSPRLYSRSLGAVSIGPADTGTLFLRFQAQNTNGDDDFDARPSFGLTDTDQSSDDPNSFSDFEVQVHMDDRNGGQFVLRGRSGGASQDLSVLLDDDTWYSLWVVIDNAADLFDVYIEGGAQYPTQTQIGSGLSFRNGTVGPLDTYFGATDDHDDDDDDGVFDDIHLSDGVNLSDPLASP